LDIEKSIPINLIREYVCPRCKYFLGSCCLPFPKEIPEAIRSGKNRHDKPFPGDKGLQFTPLTSK